MKKAGFAGVLDPGRYRIYLPTTTVQLVDIRPTFITVGGQEVLSSDGITLKVTMAAKYQIDDPEKAINSVESYTGSLYLTLQMGLREIVGTSAIDDLMEKRGEIGVQLMEKAAPDVELLGLKLLSVDLKDIMLPGEVKKLFNQIVKARKEGMAALEKARGETAALRNLANAAKTDGRQPEPLSVKSSSANFGFHRKHFCCWPATEYKRCTRQDWPTSFREHKIWSDDSLG